MIRKIVTAIAIVIVSSVVFAQIKNVSYPRAKVRFDDFKNLVSRVEPHRAKHLIDLDAFLKMSQEPGAIVLDSRSDFRFKRLHLKGAKHLCFSDYTQENLKKVIPSYETTILIYCNNNFEGNQIDFTSKVAMPITASSGTLAAQMENQEKPIMMALNIPTYINLYGYGYRNVYELDELVNVTDPRITFEGTMADSKYPE